MRFRSAVLFLILTSCQGIPRAPETAPVAVSLPSALERGRTELAEGRWGSAWTVVSNRGEDSQEKQEFLAAVEHQLREEWDKAKVQGPPRKALDLEASLEFIHGRSWAPPAVAAAVPARSSPQQWLKGMATVVVNRGFKVENGVSQPDIVIGSGFFIGADGYLLTNHHVIESEVEPGPSKSSRLSIRLQGSKGERLPAKVVGWDANLDLALLKAEYKPEFVFTLNAQADPVAGSRLQALGSPGGLEATLTEGIVSATERPLLAVGEVLQIDAAINPGNSGGPLLDAQGGVVGVVFAGIREFQGINFAIPASLVAKVLPRLQQGGRAVLPWMGLGLQEDAKGLEVLYVTPRGPGNWAGVQVGDRLTGVAGTPVSEIAEAQVRLLDFGVDAVVPLDLVRGGTALRVWSTLSARPDLPLKEAAMNDLTSRVVPLAFGVEMSDTGPGVEHNFRVRRTWAGTDGETLQLSENDTIEVLDWVADLEHKMLLTTWKVKRRLSGNMESIVRLYVPFSSRAFL